jgi:hypothetical protein
LIESTIRTGGVDVSSLMKNLNLGRSATMLDRAALRFRFRLRLLGPILIAAAALIVAACNNGTGGSGY